MIQKYIHRHQPRPVWRAIPVAGIGAFLGALILGGLTHYGNVLMMIAPFGASCVLLFAAHSSPLSQPVNVVGGHVLACLVGLAFQNILPGHYEMAAASLGFAIMVMMVFRVLHPPAGATVLVTYATATSWLFLVFPVLLGSILLVAIAALYHWLTATHYPLAHPSEKKA